MSEVSVLTKYPLYEAVIGIEVHVQLTTVSKIFCGCPNQVRAEPNANICPICAGHPGTLPVLNYNVVADAIKAGLATKSCIQTISEFARKHYFYPDLPKNYQITQADNPICTNGIIAIRLEDDTVKNIRLIRIHIEEDAGKNIHAGEESFIDLNRAGTPLLEIVSYPDIENSHQARAYLKSLRNLVMYLDICSGNMEEGAFRADTNISVRKKGAQKLGTKCELKNINSFKFIGDAIEYEIERQITLLESGQAVVQETRLWDTKNHITVPMRSKEEAADYRYLPDPDLPLIQVNQEWIDRIKKELPELPDEKFKRLTTEHGLSVYEAEILINDKELADYYEAVYNAYQSKQSINWIIRDVMGYIKDQKITLAEFKVTPIYLAHIIKLIEQGTINNRSAQEVFQEVAKTGKNPIDIVRELGLEQIGDTGELEAIIQEIVKQNPVQAAEYKAGKEKLFGFFVGQAMQKTKGKGNPQVINELLKKHLA